MTTLEQRISWFIEKAGPDDCWPWQSGVSGHGFPRIRHGGRQLAVRRIIMKTPEGMQTYQSCGNKRCCNPAHLRIGKPPGRPRTYKEQWHEFVCPQCGKKARITSNQHRTNRKNHKAGPYCSRSCAALAAWERRRSA